MSSDNTPLQDVPSPSTDADPKNSPKWRIPLLVGGALSIVALLVLTALPYVVAHYATRWLVDQGASTAHIDDVNINLFTGVVGVFGLDASDGKEAQLRIESAEVGIRWWPLAKQRVHIEFLRLEDGAIDVVAVEQGILQIGAVKIDLSTEDASDQTVEVSAADAPAWGFGSELVVVEDVQLSYRDELFATTVEARELRIGSHFSWEAGRTTDLVVDVSVDGAPLVLNSNIAPWGEQREISGALRLEDFDLSKHREALSELAGLSDPRGALQFDFQLDLLHAADGALELKISGPLQLQDVAFGMDDMSFSNKNIVWQGAVSLALPARQDKNMLVLDGSLTLADTRVDGISDAFEAQLAAFDWRGSIEFSPPATPDAPTILKSSGSLNGTDLSLNHVQLPFQLVGLQQFAVDELQVDDLSEVSAQRFSLQDLELLKDRTKEDQLDTTFSLERFDLGAFVYGAKNGVYAETMTFLQPKAVITRKPSGQLHRIQEVLDVLLSEQAPDKKELDEEDLNREDLNKEELDQQTPSTEQTTPIKFVVERIELRSDRLLQFEDQAVTPTAVLKLGETQLDVANFDTSGSVPMELTLVTQDGAMQVNAAGQLNAFSASTSATMKLELDGLDLTQISAYVPGFNIERGRLSTDSELAVDGGMLNASNALTIDRLKLSAKAAEGNAPVAEGMAMPVDVALNLLRDGDDRIKLQLPVSGSLADPEFGTGDIVRQATQKALQKAAMSYVKNALQPLGTLMLVGDLAAKAARPRFEPVVMEPGQAVLSEPGQAYLEKLAALLTERPSLPLTVCGVATPADRQAFIEQAALTQAQTPTDGPAQKNSPVDPDDTQASVSVSGETQQVTETQLRSLASQRTSSVIEFLVQQQGIDRDRLYTCRETIENTDEQPPRAEISL